MAHIRYDRGPSVIAKSDDEWYGVASQVGARANARARRTDITAVISETCGAGAPACFYPTKAELHLNRTMVPMGDPAKVNLTDRLWRLEHASAVGALEHEAAHARHTKFLTDMDADALGASRRMIDVITTLEEPRIEYNAIRTDNGARPYLRACATEIVGRDFKIAETPYGASMAAGLFLARVDAGVLTRSEAAPFRAEILAVLDETTVATLEALWNRFLRLADTDYPAMIQVAREWLEAVGMDPDADESEEADDDLAGGSMHGEGDGEDEGDGESLDGRIKERTRGMATKVDKEFAERRGEERAARRKAERDADKARAEESKTPHKSAFPGHGYSPDDYSHYVGSRQPTSEERSAARALSRTLETLDYRDRSVTKTSSAAPPGRLRGRAAVTQAAFTASGRTFDGDLWQGKVRKVVDSTPLTIGLMCDISGSMGSAMQPLAVTQWMLSTAGSHIDAKVATVHFGARVHGVMPAGTREKQIRLYSAGDGSEAFKDGALAIDRELNLLNGRGARLLVILSDGAYVRPPDEQYATKFVPLALRAGVGVMFLDFTGAFRSAYGATAVNVRGLSPAAVARLIGNAATMELRTANAG